MSRVRYLEGWYGHSRLNNTAVVFKHTNEAVWINHIEDSLVSYRILSKPFAGNLSTHLGCFEFTSLPNGYVNTGGYARYMCRAPARHYKQGSDCKNTFFINAGVSPKCAEGVQNFSDPSLIGMINEVYPSPNFAKDCIYDTSLSSVAVSRDFAVAASGVPSTLKVYYKNLLVGEVCTDTGVVTSLKGFEAFVDNFKVIWNGR